MNIQQNKFAHNQYYRQVHDKNQVYLHHTAGADNAKGVFSWWGKTQSRIATCVVIGRDGIIQQGFSSKYWAYHLGLRSKTFKEFNLPYKPLDRYSIGIELTNWGGLTKRGGKYYNYIGTEVEDVIELKYKGYKYFENYTMEQIASVKELLLLWRDKYDIDLKYNEDIWDVTPRALNGDNGVFTHNSVRIDKVDVYPHPLLIEMLQSL